MTYGNKEFWIRGGTVVVLTLIKSVDIASSRVLKRSAHAHTFESGTTCV